jgi:putative membrane protein
MLFWLLVLPSTKRRRLSSGAAVLFVFMTGLQSSCLGVVLTLATEPLYSSHVAGARAWSLTPLEDQQLAGAIMWVPPSILYLALMAWLFVRWLEDARARVNQIEQGDAALSARAARR